MSQGAQITRQCGECEGRGSVGYCYDDSADFYASECGACKGSGEALAWCTEEHHGDLVPATTQIDSAIYLCAECATRCAICTFATPADDRCRIAGGPCVAHAACIMALDAPAPHEEEPAPQMENAAQAPHNGRTTRPYERSNGRVGARAQGRRGGRAVPKMAPSLIEVMHKEGYVSIAEAAEATGHCESALRKWIDNEKLPHRRSGIFHFVEAAAVQRMFPQAAGKLLPRGRAA